MSIGLNVIAQISYNTMCDYYRMVDGAKIPCWEEIGEDTGWLENTIMKLTEKAKSGDIGIMAMMFHNAMAAKYLRAGFTHASVHNEVAKQTPFMLPLEELSKEDQAARFLFCSVVSALQFAR